MSKRFFWLALGAFLCLGSVWAAPVSPEASLRIAQQFFCGTSLRNSQVPLTLTYAHRPQSSRARNGNLRASGMVAPAYYYIYNRGDNEGFVIVSGDDRLEQILAYSYEGHFSIETAPREVLYWLGNFDREIESLHRSGVSRSAETRQSAKPLAQKVEPLLEREQIRWNQDYPFNSECPMDKTTGRQCVTGCVATALAQVLRFHKWPDVGQGSHTYIDSISGTHETRSVTFNTHYDWANMPGTYNRTNVADKEKVAKAYGLLMRDAGHSVDMMYSSRGSGALDTYIVRALRDFFKYSRATHLLYRGQVDHLKWEEAIRQELNNDRPVIFFGQGEGGHCFVCDGYDDKGLYHFNWGWGGKANAYYRLTALQPTALGIGSGMGFYDYAQSIVVDAAPCRDGKCGEEAPLSTPSVAIRANIVSDAGRQKLELVATYVQNAETKMQCSLRFAVYNEKKELVKNTNPEKVELPVYVPYINKETIDIQSLTDGTYTIQLEYAKDHSNYAPMHYLYDEPSIAFVTIKDHQVAHVDYDIPLDCLSVDPNSVNTDSLFCYEKSIVSFKVRNTSKREMYLPAQLYCVESQEYSEEESMPHYRYLAGSQMITVPAQGDTLITYSGFRPIIPQNSKVNLYFRFPRLNREIPSADFGFFSQRLESSAAKLIAKDRSIKLPSTYTDATLVCQTDVVDSVDVACNAYSVRPCKFTITNKGLLYDPTGAGAVIRGVLTSGEKDDDGTAIAISTNALSGKIKAGEQKSFVPTFSLGQEFDFLAGTTGVLHILTLISDQFGVSTFGQKIFGTAEVPVRFVLKNSREEIEVVPQEILLYPNPATTETTLRTTNPITQIEIEAIDGTRVAYYKVERVQKYQISTALLGAGKYIVHCTTSEGKRLSTMLLIQ